MSSHSAIPEPSDLPLPFEGVRILDLSQGVAGPYCAHILWQQGADVIKVEPPSGDWARGVSVLRDGTSSFLIAVNAGKRGLCVDAATEEGRSILKRFAENADVIVENFRPGVAKRLGLDAAVMRETRPTLIFVSISGYGGEGPYANLPATDSVVQADAGLMFCNRGSDAAPRKIGLHLADVNAGIYGAQAISAALYRRAVRGEGAHIEMNLFEVCAATLVCNFAEHALAPEREKVRSIIPASAPNGTFSASDGDINLTTMNNLQFASVCRALMQEQWIADSRFATGSDRVAHSDVLNAMIAKEIAKRPTQYWTQRLQECDVLHAQVRNYSQCVGHPQALHMGTFQNVEQPGIGTVALPGVPVPSMRRPLESAPSLGQHTKVLLLDAGFAPERVEQWIRDRIVIDACSLS